MTCIALRPSLPAIVEKAWEEVRRAKQEAKSIVANIREVSKEEIEVDVNGLRVAITNDNLSVLRIDDARKYFNVFDELLVNILECSEESGRLVLSNCSTDTDPKRLLDEFEGYKDTPIDSCVERIIRSVDGEETGLIVGLRGKQLKGYVLRKYATYSRFDDLSSKYHEGSRIKVLLRRFDPSHKTFACSVWGLEDPWLAIQEYNVNNIVVGTIRELSQNHILCELRPGLEAIIPLNELTWEKVEKARQILKEYKLGESVKGIILGINMPKKRLVLSVKRLMESPSKFYFDKNANGNVEATVTEIAPSFANLYLEEQVEGYLHVSEVMWNYCGDINTSLKMGQKLLVRVLEYNPLFENIRVSLKRAYSNDFEKFSEKFNVGDTVTAKIRCIGNDRVIVSIHFHGNLQVEGYVHKSELSNIFFVDENTIKDVLKIDRDYGFIVKRMDTQFQIIQLSRKLFLRAELNKIECGNVYEAIPVCQIDNRIYVHGPLLEGFLDKKRGSVTYGEVVAVLPVKIDYKSASVELDLKL